MSCKHSVTQAFPHRWCTVLIRTVLVAGLLPALFAGAANVMLLALAALFTLSLLMVASAMRATRRGARHRVRPVRAVLALTTDALLVLIATGLLIGALIGDGTGSVISSSAGGSTLLGLLTLCAIHHVAHRRPRRR
ncbi:hypothetical protein [Streptomyces nigrescens]|uniref:hypothetical protein n=1 Tax=Streptomyces nigrescens TaxID=1920 RepID=UPI0036FEBDD9